MARIHPGRCTATIDGDFVVFAVGMRINRWWKPWRWLPVVMAMPPMLRELRQRPESGFLGARLGWIAGGPFALQYWRSFEHLEAYARDREQSHWPAWVRFNRRVARTGDAGIWHETYRVAAGSSEAVYVNMPRILIAEAGEHATVGAASDSAALRMGNTSGDHTPAPEPGANADR